MRTGPGVRALALFASAICCALATPGANAQPEPAGAPSSVAMLFGLPGLQQAAKAASGETRAAAVLRAAELARAKETPALMAEECWKLVEGGATDAIGDDPDASLRVRLVAARALVDDRRVDGKRALRDLFLSPAPSMKGPVIVVAGPKPPFKVPSAELVRYVRQTAAMALAVVGDDETLLQKLRGVAGTDPDAGIAALEALAAHAPAALTALVGKSDSVPASDVVEALVRMGDLRAADALVRAFEKQRSAAALRGLAKLGDPRAATLARTVQKTDNERVRVAGAEALAELGEADAEEAILRLLEVPSSAAAGRDLAARFPSPKLVPILEEAARSGSGLAASALARAGGTGPSALAALARDDAHADGADAAAFALATAPGPFAEKALASLASDSPTPARVRRAVRAGAIRVARLGAVPSAVRSAAKSLGSATDPEGRYLSVLLPAVLSLSDARDAVTSSDPLARRAGVVALLSHPAAEAAEIARKALASELDPELRRGLVGAAARGIDGTLAHDVPVPSSQLAAWLGEEPGPSAAVAAFVLGARGGNAAAPHLQRALEADDLAVRAAALLGLGLCEDADATARLSARLLDGLPVELRRVSARALAARADPGAAPALSVALRLDGDAEVRAIARRKGPRVSPLLSGFEVAQTKVVGVSAVRPTLRRSDGLSLPLLVDPAGFVLAFRLPAGETRVTLHPSPVWVGAKP